MLHKRGKFNFLLGVQWHVPQDKADLKTLLSSYPGQSRAVVTLSGETWVGFDEGRDVGIAGALAIAQVFPDLILAERLSDDQYWLCVTHNGKPVQGRDMISSVDDMRSILYEWTNFFPSATVYGDLEGSIGSADEVWERVLGAISGKEISSKRIAEFKLKTVLNRGERLVAFGAAIGLAMLIATAWFVFKPKPLTAEEMGQQMQSAAEIAAKLKAEQERLAAIAARVKLHKEQVATLQTRIERARSETSLDGWIGSYRKLPLSLHGYKPINMSCTIQVCQVQWGGSGNNFGLRIEDKYSIGLQTGAVDKNVPLPAVAASAAASAALAPPPPAPVAAPTFVLNNTNGDYGVVLDYLVQPVKRPIVKAQEVSSDLSAHGLDLLRARLLDLAAMKYAGRLQLTLSAPAPLSIPGVPEANVPDALLAYVMDLSVNVNGSSARVDLVSLDREITERLAPLGVVLSWNDMALLGATSAESINARASLYLVSLN